MCLIFVPPTRTTHAWPVLGILHKHGWVHRDLSYGNVLVDPQGRARLIDFEFAKMCANKDEPEFRVVCMRFFLRRDFDH